MSLIKNLNEINDIGVGHRLPLMYGFSRKRLVTHAMYGTSDREKTPGWGKDTLAGNIALSCYAAITNDYNAQPLFLRVHDVHEIERALNALDTL